MTAKTQKLRELKVEELQVQIDNARQELMNLRFQQATGELTDYTRLRHTRRQIARLTTILAEQKRKEGEA